MAIPEIFNYTGDPLADNESIAAETVSNVLNRDDEAGYYRSDVGDKPAAGFYIPPPEKEVEASPFSQEEDLIAAWGKLGDRPKPEYDEAREKRLQTIAGAGGVAKALSLLGDAFAVSRNAPILRDRIQTEDPNVRMIMQDRKDYKNKLDDYQQQQYLDSIRRASGLTAARGADYREGQRIKERQEVIDTQERRRAEDIGMKEAALGYQKDRDTKADEFKQKQFDQTKKYQDAMLEINRTNADYAQTKAQQEALEKKYGKPYDLISGDTRIKLYGTGELDRALTAILGDQQLQIAGVTPMQRMKLLKGNLEGISPSQKTAIVQEYWDKSTAAREAIKGMIASRGMGDMGTAAAGGTTPAPAGVPSWMANTAGGTPPTTRNGVPMARPKDQEGEEVKVTQTTTPEGGAKETTTVKIDPNALQKAVQAKDSDAVSEMMRSGGATPEQIDAFLKKYDVLKAGGAKQEGTRGLQTESQKMFAEKQDLKASDVGDAIRRLAELGGIQTKDEKGRDTEEYKQFFKENYEAVNNDYQAEVKHREGKADEDKARKRKAAYDKYGTLKTP